MLAGGLDVGGKRQQSITMAAVERKRCGIRKPMAMAISAMPARLTQRPALPMPRGTMRMRSGRRLPQCAEADKKNMAPRAAQTAVTPSAK